MSRPNEDKISDDEFFPRLDEDLYEKFLARGEEYFDDPMMRHCYLQIQNCREAKLAAVRAQIENEMMQQAMAKSVVKTPQQ